MTSSGCPFTVRVAPIAAGEPPNSRCQNAWLSTTPGARHPRTSSVSSNTRPAAGPTPSTLKNVPLTQRPSSAKRDSPDVARSKVACPHASTPVNAC